MTTQCFAQQAYQAALTITEIQNTLNNICEEVGRRYFPEKYDSRETATHKAQGVAKVYVDNLSKEHRELLLNHQAHLIDCTEAFRIKPKSIPLTDHILMVTVNRYIKARMESNYAKWSKLKWQTKYPK